MKTYEKALIEATAKAKEYFSENWKSIPFTESESYNPDMIKMFISENLGNEYYFGFFANTKDYHMKNVFYHVNIKK